MAHNYYLYADPDRQGRLRWIPWDNNFAFGLRPALPGGMPPPGRSGFPAPGGAGVQIVRRPLASADDVLHAQVGRRWPLIQRLLADPVYAERYRALLEHAIGGLFAPAAFEARVRELHALVAPAVVGTRGERDSHTTVRSPEAFAAAVDGPDGLLEFARKRREAVRQALETSR
jgi:hypothetical protein